MVWIGLTRMLAVTLVTALFVSDTWAEGALPTSRGSYSAALKYEQQAAAAIEKRSLSRLRAIEEDLANLARKATRRFIDGAQQGKNTVDQCDTAIIGLVSIVSAAITELENSESRQARATVSAMLENGHKYRRNMRACESILGVRPAAHPDLVSAVQAQR